MALDAGRGVVHHINCDRLHCKRKLRSATAFLSFPTSEVISLECTPSDDESGGLRVRPVLEELWTLAMGGPANNSISSRNC